MKALTTLVLSIFMGEVFTHEDLSFPRGFIFGAASSSYQVEGAWNVSDKSESIWDRFTHKNQDKIDGASNGDIACGSYHNWKRDIEMAEELGLHFYRFSISWVRLLPTGFPNYISEDGKRYYNNLIDGLLAKNIQPMVTIYHWDLPQRLQDLGGWTNPHISEWFADYARTVFSIFGDRVKIWLTINEPQIFCETSYNMGAMAPGLQDSEVGSFLCVKHALLAHAKAWRIYDKEFRDKYQGQVSLANHMFWYEPHSEEDRELTELVQEYSLGRYAHPIYSKQGGWPVNITKALALASKRQGYPKSNFPSLSKHEIEYIKGTYDFFAFNHYSSRMVRKPRRGEKLNHPPLGDIPDLEAKLLVRPEWARTSASWLYVNPVGIRNQLNWVKQQYGDIKIFITENGYAGHEGLNDTHRIHYHKENLKQILLAIKEDGINIVGYTVWTLMDNFEWNSGYATKFGLYQVDFNSPHRTRTPRASAYYYRNIIRAHSLNVSIPKIHHVRDASNRIAPSLLVLYSIFVSLKSLV